MKSFLPILLFFVVFAAIFSTSTSLRCHVCTASSAGCAKPGGGKVDDCSNSITSPAVACATTNYGEINRLCLDANGLKNCKLPACKSCTTGDACNT